MKLKKNAPVSRRHFVAGIEDKNLKANLCNACATLGTYFAKANGTCTCP